jgi:hypothetical protein
LSVSKFVPVVDCLKHASKPSGCKIMRNLPAECELASQKNSCAMELEFKKCVILLSGVQYSRVSVVCELCTGTPVRSLCAELAA